MANPESRPRDDATSPSRAGAGRADGVAGLLRLVPIAVSDRARTSSAFGRPLGLAVIAGAMIASLIAISSGAGLPIFFTSWASSVALLLASPHASVSAPHRIALCHITAALIGLCLHAFMPESAVAVGVAVFLSVAVVSIGDIMHPPAIANAAIAFSTTSTLGTFAATAVLGGVVLAGFALVYSRLYRPVAA